MHILNRMTNYIVPTPRCAGRTILIECPYPHGPGGGQGIGELPMDGGLQPLRQRSSMPRGGGMICLWWASVCFAPVQAGAVDSQGAGTKGG